MQQRPERSGADGHSSMGLESEYGAHWVIFGLNENTCHCHLQHQRPVLCKVGGGTNDNLETNDMVRLLGGRNDNATNPARPTRDQPLFYQQETSLLPQGQNVFLFQKPCQ